MKKIFLPLCLTFFTFLYHIALGQDRSAIPVAPYVAESKFIKNNFEAALDDYLFLLEQDPKNEKYNYNIAVCYLNTNIDKTKAIPYLETITANEQYDPNALYLLGRAYSFAYRFDNAIEAYNKFRRIGKGNDANLKDVDRQIQFCINAKELIKFPVDVTFENLGITVNSAYADYYPYVPGDESFLIFNSRRPLEGAEKPKEDGNFTADIYVSKVTNGTFVKAKELDPLVKKGTGEQEIIGLTGKGDLALIYYTNEKKIGDIYSSEINSEGKFSSAIRLDENINSQKAQEIAASINTDGTVLYFASNREGGLGGTDIYQSIKLPNGKWGKPKNLGPEINTAFDEDFPNISPDGKILYYSSNGFTSMGGYDIFKAEMNLETQQFTNPRNIGYPINTPEDNYNFRISKNGQYGYMSALRPNGYGDLDIYRIRFNSVEPLYSVITGNITCSDSLKKIYYPDVFITVNKKNKTHELVGNYLLNQITGRYVIALQPGDYDITYSATGFETIKKEMTILDKSSFKFEIIDNIIFKPKK